MSDDEVFRQLARGVVLGRYHLVLGSGASFGSRNSAGDDLPLANQLTNEILRSLGYDQEGIGLTRAYEALTSKRGKTEAERFLKEKFSSCQPDEWVYDIPRLTWPAIWTFNVDDVIEMAYQGSTDARQAAKPHLPMDRPHPLLTPQSEVPIVHLHGYVGSIAPVSDPQVIFSIEEYLAANAVLGRNTWHTAFQTALPNQPIIAIGASLVDEVDIAMVLRSGSSSSIQGLPSVVVRPDIDSFLYDELIKWNFTPLDMTGAEFFERLDAAISEFCPDELTLTDQYALSALTKFRDVRNPFPTFDFYAGHEPDASVVLNGLDAVPKWVDEVVEEIGPSQDYSNRVCYLIQGNPFSGKSTALLRIASELEQRGWMPYFVNHAAHLDPAEIVKFIGDRPNTCLFVDNAAPFSSELRRVFERFSDNGRSLLVVAAERRGYKAKRLIDSLGSNLVGNQSEVFVEPDQGLWHEIVSLRSKGARLGRLEGVQKRDQAYHFIKHNSSLFSALSALEDADGFIDRVKSEVADLSPVQDRILATTAFAGLHGLSIDEATVSAVAGIARPELIAMIRDSSALSTWVAFDQTPGQLQLRHRYVADMLLAGSVPLQLDVSMSDLLLRTSITLSPSVGKRAIQTRSHPYKLLREFMHREMVGRVTDPDAIDDWYGELIEQGGIGWLSGVWEQRALAISDTEDGFNLTPDFAKAYSYAQRAVSSHDNANARNTLGTVLARRAISSLDSPRKAREYWAESHRELVEARKKSRGDSEYPYITAFAYALRLAKATDDSTLKQAAIATIVDFATEMNKGAVASQRRVIRLRNEALRECPPLK